MGLYGQTLYSYWHFFKFTKLFFLSCFMMNTIVISTESSVSKVFIGETFNNLAKYLSADKVVIITDKEVNKHYGNSFPSSAPVIEIGRGEKHKTLETVQTIMSRLIEEEADRSTFVVGIGGGIVCDVAGFAASIFMRGLPFGFVSTTLLSQVDASVGGKNGVNYDRYKNMIGVFRQPEFVICDVEMLKTLDKREYRAGLAEIVKAAAIRNKKLFEYLEQHTNDILDLKTDIIEKIVYESVLIKSEVVEADEKEKGERRILNFGHTLAHAFEKLSGILHGEAVSIGMALAAKLSTRMGLLEEDTSRRLTDLLKKFGLPVSTDIDKDQLFAVIKHDKKREGDSIHLVLLNQLGNAIVEPVLYSKLQKMINDLY